MLRLLTIVAIFVPVQSPAIDVRASGKCLDWSVAAPIVKKQGLATVQQLTRLARQKKVGDILRAKLCEDRGVFTYRLVVRDPKGRLRILTVDASRPFER